MASVNWYGLCSAIAMCQQRRAESETFMREGDAQMALLAVESLYYWKGVAVRYFEGV